MTAAGDMGGPLRQVLVGDDEPDALATLLPHMNDPNVGGVSGNDGIRSMYQTLFHEAAHQFVSLTGPFVPGWLNEAYASFFKGCVIRSNGTVKWNRAPPGTGPVRSASHATSSSFSAWSVRRRSSSIARFFAAETSHARG